MTPSQRLTELARHLQTDSLPRAHVAHLLLAEAESIATMERELSNVRHTIQIVRNATLVLVPHLDKLGMFADANLPRPVDGGADHG